MPTAPVDRIVGRDAELSVVESLLATGRGRPAAVVLVGEAGIGKTTLWQHGVDRAVTLGFRVLRCRLTQAEARRSLSGLLDLLDEVADDVLAGLPEPQRHALEVALCRRLPDGTAPDAGTLDLAVLATLRRLAATGPVLVAVDDTQWLDERTAELIAYAARRLRHEPVAVLAAVRGRPDDPLPFGLPEALPTDRLAVGRLAPAPLRRLVVDRTGVELSRPTLLRMHETCGGNPFYAIEIATALKRADTPLVPGEPLPIPANLTDLVSEHVRGLPRPTRDALLYVAALAQPTTAVVRAAVGTPAGEISPLAAAEEAGVVEVRGRDLRFAHPLYASTVTSLASIERRRHVHGRLAALVDDPEERARHLALATDGADPAVAASLDQAAVGAQLRGAPGTAAQLWELAAGRTPTGDPESAWRRTVAAAECVFATGDVTRARHILAAVTAQMPVGLARARVMFTLAEVVYYEGRMVEASDLCRRALPEAAGDPVLRAALHLRRSWFSHFDASEQLRGAEAAVGILADLDVPAAPAMFACALAELAMNRFVAGGPIAADDLSRAKELLRAGTGPWVGWAQTSLAAWAKYLDPVEARERFQEQYRQAEETGDEPGAARKLVHLSEIDCWLGDWTRSRQEAHRAMELVEQTGQRRWQIFGRYALALVEAHLGNQAVARTAIDEGLALAEAADDPHLCALHHQVAGFLELSRGDFEAADRHLTQAADLVDAMRVREPARFMFHGDQIEVAAALGHTDRAGRLLDRLRSRVPRPWLVVVSERAEAVVHLSAGDLPAAEAAAERALAACEGLAMPFERARCLLVLGGIRRAAKRRAPARAALTAAHDLFVRLGARLWADRAAADLLRCGQRTESAGVLTATEQRVAALVASGLTNREVAAIAYISPKTVEVNLSRIYRKLSVRNRTELATFVAGLGAGAPSA
jgi:DNA-binding CsgD family transcriptional regulator/tetratricopeptide (TPR) repeat protein